MPGPPDAPEPSGLHCRWTAWFTVACLLQILLVIWIALLSERFAHGTTELDRPIGSVVGLFTVAFALQLFSVFTALRLKDSLRLKITVIGVATAMRLVLLFSHPIQEVDLYRYIWDGSVSAQGVNPYRYSPESIVGKKEAASNGRQRLAELIETDSGIAEVHSRVHFAEITTIYPPVSQFIFLMAHGSTPTDSSATVRVRVMKLFVIGFDLATFLVLMRSLIRLKQHTGWAIVYGWSPLVLKEFANSGHLDSIAVFFMVLGIFLSLKVSTTSRFFSAASMGLAVGAKLFPLVLFPVLITYLTKRFGWRQSVLWACVAIGSSLLFVSPMLMSRSEAESTGLRTFLGHWEINDLIFMIVQENVRPDQSIADHSEPWFVFAGNNFRTWAINRFIQVSGCSIDRSPFMLARTIVTIAFAVIVLWLCGKVYRNPDRTLEAVFLTLAWFWLLAPTLNPWYWTWAMPMVVFARGRMWLMVSGLAMIYYLRFWFEYHDPIISVAGTSCSGVSIFDYWIVWIEFMPLLVMLTIARLFPMGWISRSIQRKPFW